MLLGIFDTILLFLSLGISLLIVVPLTGVLVRFRANYNPKALQLDAEGGAVPHTGPVINSYFSMMARVWKLEVRPLTFETAAQLAQRRARRVCLAYTRV